MRIAVVGLGRIGQMHARNAAQHRAVSEVLLVGRDAGRLRSARSAVEEALRPGAPRELAGEFAGSDEPAALREITDIDVALGEAAGVIIATTTATHPELTRRAVAAGVPVLVEKPLAFEPAEVAALADELERTDVPVMVAFHRRYDPGYRALRDRVAAGDAGVIRVLRATGHDHFPLNPDYIPASGGIFRDLMVHDFDIIPWVAGEPVVRVQAYGAVLDDSAYAEHGDVDTAVAVLTLGSGAVATVSGVRRNGAGHDVRLEVYGTKNTFSAGLDERTPMTSTEPGIARPKAVHDDFTNRFEPAFRAEVDHFTKVVEGTAESLSPPREGLAAIRTAVAAEESLRTGRPIELR